MTSKLSSSLCSPHTNPHKKARRGGCGGVLGSGDGIVYELPNIKTACSNDEYVSYLPLLRPFKLWYSSHLETEHIVFVSRHPFMKEIEMTHEDFAKSKYPPISCICISNVPANVNDFTCGYLWRIKHAEYKDDKHLDSTDSYFLSGKPNIDAGIDDGSHCRMKKFIFFGLHTYHHDYRYFQPDLKEVIALMAKKIPPSMLPAIETIYLTSETHPTEHSDDNFVAPLDRHRGKTTVYVIMKPVVISSSSPSPPPKV